MRELIQYILSNVWSNIRSETQITLRISRLTPSRGAINTIPLMLGYINAPIQSKPFHVFQIGQLLPSNLSLPFNDVDFYNNVWVNIADLINNNHINIEIYDEKGLQIPKFECWFTYTQSKDLIIAIQDNNFVPINYGEDNIYIRFYTNTYFNTAPGKLLDNKLYVTGKTGTTIQDVADLKTLYNSLSALQGKAFFYMNGLLYSDITSAEITNNSTIEVFYDASIARIITFPLVGIKQFSSVLDTKLKYLLHYPKQNNNDDGVWHIDDVSGYITYGDMKPIGNYLHRNDKSNFRMVSHKDYSVSVSYIQYMLNVLKQQYNLDVVDLDKTYIKLFLRLTGLNNSLINENNRLLDLYGLPDTEVKDAMIGTIGAPNNFRVETLENSLYSRIMTFNYEQINIENSKQALGYNACSKVLGDTPIPVTLENEIKTVRVPPAYQTTSTVYEYDSSGVLIGIYYNLNSNSYMCGKPECDFVEFKYGIGTDTPNVRFGFDEIPILKNEDYRVYKTNILNNTINPNWIDITGSDLYTVIADKIVWVGEEENYYLMVRLSDGFLDYEMSLIPENGNLLFDIQEVELRDPYHTDKMLVNIPLIEDFNSLVGGVNIFGEPTITTLNQLQLNSYSLTQLKSGYFTLSNYITTVVNFTSNHSTLEFNLFVNTQPVLGYNKTAIQLGSSENGSDGFLITVSHKPDSLYLILVQSGLELCSIPIEHNKWYNCALVTLNGLVYLIINGSLWSYSNILNDAVLNVNNTLRIGSGYSTYEQNSAVIQISNVVVTDVTKHTTQYTPLNLIPYIDIQDYEINGVFPVPVPGDTIDVFLNNRLLIEDIDYKIIFPRVCIFNKEYLTPDPLTTEQLIRIRVNGFCDKDLNYRKDEDSGFIKHGLLSMNGVYDLRNDRVTRIIVDGCMKLSSQVVFAEDVNSIPVDQVLNGRPYSVRDVIVPINGFINEDSQTCRERSVIIDNNVRSYLTDKKPQINSSDAIVVSSRYQVYSPFINSVINLLNNGTISDSTLDNLKNDSDILNYCNGFDDILRFDLAGNQNTYDPAFIIIHPTNLSYYTTLTEKQFSFISDCNRLFCNNKIDLSSFLNVE